MYSEVFCVLFFTFCISQHFMPVLAFGQKVKGFRGLFFCGINKIRNSHEVQKVYSKCFVLCGVFCGNVSKIPAKCEIRKVYSQPHESSVAGFSNRHLLWLETVNRCFYSALRGFFLFRVSWVIFCPRTINQSRVTLVPSVQSYHQCACKLLTAVSLFFFGWKNDSGWYHEAMNTNW